jgi:peptidoglycan/LPS O-acetylase OafA/YrhL
MDPYILMKALPNLDFLRAVAVLSVVLCHTLLAYKVYWIGYWNVAWIGVVGVFVFFVHTSLVLMWSLERKPHTLDFYIRRIFRIYPLAMFAIMVTLLFHVPLNSAPNEDFFYIPPHGWGDVLSALLLAGNLFHPYAPVPVTWSLPYEVQMYLALPVIFFFVRRNFSLWPLLLYWGFVIAVCHGIFGNAQGHNLFLCIPYFLPGVMAYVGFGRRQPVLAAWLMPIGLAALWFGFMAWPGWRVADVLCLAVGLGLPSFHQITSRWLIRASHEVAKYSYSIYLVHPFSLVLGLYLMPHRSLALQLMVILGSLVVLSVGAYHLLEKPMIQVGARLARRAEARFEQYDATLPRRKPEDNPHFEPRPTE